MSIARQLFTCKREGLLIRGAQYYPADFEEEKSYPAVIISHGFTGIYTDVDDFCRDFAQMGYVAFCFSFCGGSRFDADDSVKSEGKTTDMTIGTEVADLLAVKEYVQSLPFTDNNNLVLLGFSQGGFVSGLAAAKCGNEIGKLIMVFPALCIPDHARRGCLGGASYDVQRVPEIIDCGNITLGKKFHDTVVGMDPYLELSAYKGPVLILQGMEDKIVDYSYAVRAQANYEKGQCNLQLIQQMGHGYDEQQQKSIVASMRQFLSGREEILTIRVVITRCESVEENDMSKCDVYFTGYCDTRYFQGAIVPEGCDKQEYVAGKQPKLRAEYTLLGNDYNGENCSLHIVNQWDNDEWRPMITTKAPSLAWLNDADLTAVLEFGKGGLTVRVFAPTENR